MRTKRIKNEGEGYYHLFSRCALKSFLFKDEEKAMFVKMMRKVEYFCGIEILSYCVMGNHFHILAHIPGKQEITEEMLIDRVSVLYGISMAHEIKARWEEYRKNKDTLHLEKEQELLRRRMGDISPFMQTLKQRFSTWYRHNHDFEDMGTFWQGRFGSTLVEGTASTLSAVSAYIDLNPVRAGIVTDPKDYRWSSYGSAMDGDAHSMQGLAHIYDEDAESTDFIEEYAPSYREKLYVKGSDSIDRDEVEKVIKAHGQLPLAVLLRCKVRYFTKSTIFGSKEFVNAEFAKHRYAFSENRKTGARGIGICKNWDGIRLYSARGLQKTPVIAPAMA